MDSGIATYINADFMPRTFRVLGISKKNPPDKKTRAKEFLSGKRRDSR
jgi:hypothetical protein